MGPVGISKRDKKEMVKGKKHVKEDAPYILPIPHEIFFLAFCPRFFHVVPL